MFAPNRFVVVDDDEGHLAAIRGTIEQLGSACVAIRYEEGTPIPEKPFARARVIFMDLQLRDRQASSSFNTHYAEIQGILTRVIPEDGGPFLMVVWTDKPERVQGLEAYLERYLFKKRPYTRPIKIIPMSKADFIEPATGAPLDPEGLKAQIRAHLGSEPALASLLQWESEIIAATDRVVHDVVGLTQVTSGVHDLSAALKRLATEAVGGPNVSNDPQAAVHGALLPLLQDHVQYEVVGDPAHPPIWNSTFDGSPDPLPKLTREQAADLNSKVHVGGPSATLRSTTWGAICELEDRVNWRREFGLRSSSDYLAHVTKRVATGPNGAKPDVEKVHLAQVRIGAACDYAQKTDGPMPFVLGAFVPIFPKPPAAPNGKAVKPAGVLKLAANATCWLSPVLNIGDWGHGHLVVDPRFIRIRGEGYAKGFKPVGRMREQLLMELISMVSMHSARPGIIQFRPD